MMRRLRVELRESLGALEQALAAPASGRAERWAEPVHVALAELTGDLREHIAATEGPDGLHQDIRVAATRLCHAVQQLDKDHARIAGQLSALLTRMVPRVQAEAVEAIRNEGTALLAALSRHRQRGADLVYEAYQESIIGGET
jgi:hypothetical protein